MVKQPCGEKHMVGFAFVHCSHQRLPLHRGHKRPEEFLLARFLTGLIVAVAWRNRTRPVSGVDYAVTAATTSFSGHDNTLHLNR